MNRTTRTVLVSAALAVATVATVALASSVTLPHVFTSGGTIYASEVNANFDAVKSAVDDNASRITALESSNAVLLARLAALENAAAAHQSYFVGQGAVDANASVDDTWVDVPGVSIPVTFNAPTTIRYQVFARIYNWGGAAGTQTNCSVRLVQDAVGTPLNPVSPATVGDWNGVLTGGDLTPGNAQQVALGGQKPMPAGSYTFKLQVVRKAMAGNSGNCSIFRWSFSRAQFFLDTVP